MGLINLPSLDDITSMKDPKQQMEALVNTMGLLMKSLSELNGYINSKNVLEVGGWRVDASALQSKDGDVGMSTADSAFDDVRFWAGDINPDMAPFRVTKSGKAYLTGAVISSGGTYPKVVMDPASALFGAYTSATEYLEVRSQHYSSGYSTPLVEFGYGGNVAFMYYNAAGFGLSVADDININANGDYVKLSHARVPDWMYISTPVESLASKFTYYDSQITALNTALAGKSNVGHTHSVNIPGHNHGIGDLTGLATSGGGSVTYSTYGGTTVTTS